MSSIQHPNVLETKTYRNDGKKIKKNGQEVKVSYAVLELA